MNSRDAQVPEEVASIFANLVKRWGDADLNLLLDYVYFDTEPMESATRGELLDFTALTPTPPSVVPTFDALKLNGIRSRIRERARAMGLTREGAHFPSVDVASERAWDEDDRPVSLPLGGRDQCSRDHGRPSGSDGASLRPVLRGSTRSRKKR